MTPRWWDWTALLSILGAGALWVGADMPGLPEPYNPLRTVPPAQVLAVAEIVPLPPDTARVQLPPVDRDVVTIPAPVTVKPVVTLSPPRPDTPVAPPKPPLPEVIRPSGGDLREGHSQSSVSTSQLPVVIHPSDQSQPSGVSGTGFFIARDGSIMTVAHVVRECKRIAVASRHLRETSARLLAADFGKDIAVLVANNTRPPAVLALVDLPYGAETLDIFGYPADGDRLVPTQAHGRLRTDRPSFKGMERLDRADLLWMDANMVRPGFSGGPVINPNGEVVGLINGQVVRHTGAGGVIVRDTKYVFGGSTRTIHAFLSQEVPMLLPDASQNPSPEDVDKAIVHVTCMK